jgi:negative regulator of sigma E activity
MSKAFWLALALAAPPPDPQALLAHADRVRNAWDEAVFTLRVTTEKPGAPPATGLFEVASKGREKSRITFLDPADAGKLAITVGDDVWLLLPHTKNPIKVPRSQRIRGGFSAADISRTRFAGDYDAVWERTDDLGGRPCDVLRLIGRKGKSPSYPVVRVWIDRKEGLYRRAVFLLASGKTAKDTTFDEYRAFHGVLSLAKMTIVDSLRPGTTVVDYVDYKKQTLPESLFDPMAPR